MLETTDQPDAAYRVSGGFGFDNRDISLEEQKEADSHRLEGLWEPGRQGSCCLPGWDGSHGSRSFQATKDQFYHYYCQER